MSTPPDPISGAADRFRVDVVADLRVDDALDHVRATPPPRRTAQLVAMAAVIIALVVGVTQFRPNDDVEVAVEEVTTSSSTSVPAPTVPDPGVSLALGAANDGVESVGLPITVSPATALLDGQEVTVTGSGFPPGESVGVVMCTREAARDYGAQGVAACNLGGYASATSDAAGVASATFVVRRVVTLNGVEVDCAESEGRCLIGMGLISDYDQSGGALVNFDPTVALPPRATFSADPVDNLRDGDPVTVTSSYPEFQVLQCVTGTDDCHYQEGIFRSGDAIPVWRQFTTYNSIAPQAIDCAAVSCELRTAPNFVDGRLTPAPIPLRFDPNGPTRSPATVTVRPGTTVPAGSEITVRVADSTAPYSMTLCQPGATPYDEVEAGQARCLYAHSLDSPTLQVFDDPLACGAEGCTLTVTVEVMAPDSGDTPPPLPIEPIRILLTDV